MATLVKFYKEENENNSTGFDVLAVFPQLNWTSFSKLTKTCYVHKGQHTAVSVDYYKALPLATAAEYLDLKEEIESIGYDLKVLNK